MFVSIIVVDIIIIIHFTYFFIYLLSWQQNICIEFLELV